MVKLARYPIKEREKTKKEKKKYSKFSSIKQFTSRGVFFFKYLFDCFGS